MQDRKIFNYESVVLVDMTIEKEGYHPDKYGRSSAKFIWASCRFCGQPSRIRKGFFNKAGSACHKPCMREEQKLQKSPFTNPETRKKAEQTNMERYGVKQASRNKNIAKKISETKKTKASQLKVKKTNLERHGVENPFQSEKIKKKIRKTNEKKYCVSHPMQNKRIQDKVGKTNRKRYGVDCVLQSLDIKEKGKDTNFKKYGVSNPMQNPEIQQKALTSFEQTVLNDNEKYHLINTLRGKYFWKRMAENKLTLHQLCDEFDLDYQSTTARLLHVEFRDKYYSTYNFPRQQQQKELKAFVENLGHKTEYNTRKIIPPLELDIYVPDKRFAIEFNGNYWHSEAHLSASEAKIKHLTKTRMCQQKGIRLLHVFEQRWSERKDQYSNFVQNILHNNTIRIAARKCQLNNSNSGEFIKANHLQGKPHQVLQYFNLLYDGQVVATMTASRHHRQNSTKDQIVLSRFCSKGGCNIQGGASRLFKHFVDWAKHMGYVRIISWSDNSWTYGDIYPILGFILMKEYEPDYFYWDMNLIIFTGI